MSKEFNFLLEQKSLLEPDQNFLIFHQSYPFTSAQLRQKRLLAFFLKKWLLLNGNPTLAMIIITFLLSVIPRNYTASEDELLDIFESIVQSTNNMKYYTKRIVDALVAEYSQEHKKFKTNKKQMKFILRWYSALIRTDDYEELFFSLKNRIDQRIFEGIDSTLIFLLAQLSRDHNFDEVDHAMVVDHMREFGPNEIYVINEYAKDMQYYYKDEEVLDYLAILRFSESKDALALQKTYIKSLQRTRNPEIIVEAKDVLRKDPYDARNIDLIFDCLEKVQDNEDDQDELFSLLDILLEMIPVNNNKKRIWKKFRVFLETFRDQLLLNEYFDAKKSSEFIELYYNKIPLLNDAKEYLLIKKKSLNKTYYKMEIMDTKDDSDNCLMEDKVVIVQILNDSDPTAKEYIAAFQKISSL